MSSTPQLSLRFMKRPKNRKMEKKFVVLLFSIKTEAVGCFFEYKPQLDLMYLQMLKMNTKRHRCSRAKIIYCNYDNTRLIQDVGIGVGWMGRISPVWIHQPLLERGRERKKDKLVANVFRLLTIASCCIFFFFPLFFLFFSITSQKPITCPCFSTLQSQPLICNLSSSYSL